MNFLKLAAAALIGLSVLAAQASPILIVHEAAGSYEYASVTQPVLGNLTALHEAVGNTVTAVSALPADLSGYAQVWDLRVLTALDASAAASYTGFLQAGGGLFLTGELGGHVYDARNASLLALIDALGGGSLGFHPCTAAESGQTVQSPFTGPNAVSQVQFQAPGCFGGYGSGQWVANNGSVGAGVAYEVGTLDNAGAGALVAMLDINFMMNVYDLPNSQNLTKNLIRFLGDQADAPTPVPEPGSLALVGIAALAAAAVRRRPRTGTASARARGSSGGGCSRAGSRRSR